MGERRKFLSGDEKALTDEEALKIANAVMKSDWFYLKEYYSGKDRVYFPFASDEADTRLVVVDRKTQKRYVKLPKDLLQELRDAERKVLADLSDRLYEWG